MKKKLKKYNVFYTIPAVEYEVVVEAASVEQAVKKVKNSVLKEHIDYIRGGWEVS